MVVPTNKVAVMAQWLYVLELRGGRYYVGVTNDVRARFQEHLGNGRYGGAAWTRRYTPIRIVEYMPFSMPELENAVTKRYMRLHGWRNVRGGSYSNIRLSSAQIETIEREQNASGGNCIRCGSSAHWMRNCHEAHDNDSNGSRASGELSVSGASGSDSDDDPDELLGTRESDTMGCELDGESDGESEVELVGESDGESDGELEVELVGETDGESDRESDGESEVELVGESDGESDDELDDESDGELDGALDGESDAESDGEY